MKERRASQKLSSKSIMDPNQNVKCKIVVVGDSQCGKTALLHVFAKDCFPENYVPTVFENYTASFEIDTQRIELSLWDTSGSPYYDNVRPLSYPDSDAVLICFDISRPETLDSVLKKWKGEIQEFCPNTKMLLVGCKSDLRTDVSTLVELSNHRQTPVSYDQSLVLNAIYPQEKRNGVPPGDAGTGSQGHIATARAVWKMWSSCS
ncbi:PREDICTED: rho-related GTP-binding protein RhoE isoform X2 [Rhinopithecus bieti]|uniref:rho-related GTP-binding protein RhoE isoform X2 n=1 Tax=Rhinopithecus bieti TaxID=61621 RepID=UPI00083C0E69|nr:PREDICTED: rho-related GTP-binding protein RhoE isoform X2 [Rhinopithecus bieti]